MLCALAAAGAVALPVAAAVQAPERSLCKPAEAIVLSCSVGRKIVSLCAAGTAGADALRMTYRYGAPNRMELVYPADGAAARFYQASAPVYGGGITSVSFSRAGYEYSVFAKQGRAAGGGDPEFEDGVIISRGGQRLKTLVCDDGGAGFRQSIEALPAKPAK